MMDNAMEILEIRYLF